MEINLIIEGILSAGIAVTAFFVKRTINELDECRKNIFECASKDDLNICKNDIAKIKEDYITKEDFFREQTENRRKLDKIMDILMEIKRGEKK